jgi:antitoxin (DNA-binding transcriptional repressor) of toxin-antitoxin stability system
MYICMKHYDVATARRHLADALDAAEAGEPVVIERRGVRFQLARLADQSPRRTSGPVLIEILDPAVETGRWTWRMTSAGLRFSPTRPPGKRPRTSR